MKAIVLAAGKGERLKEITKKIPKPMLKVGGEIILEHNLKWLKKQGINDIYINLHHLPDVIRDYLGDGSKLGIKITYSYEPELLGTAGAVREIAQNWSEPFLVVYGDSFYSYSHDLRKIIDFHFESNGIATLGLCNNNDEAWKSGVVILGRNNLIADFLEKPSFANHLSDGIGYSPDILKRGLISMGLYIFEQKMVDYILKGSSDFGKDIFPNLAKRKVLMYGCVFREPLISVDTIEGYEKQQAANNQ